MTSTTPAISISENERRRLAEESADPKAHFARARRTFGITEEVPYDSSGRIILPPMMRRKGQIEDLALFVGVGGTFEIWNPQAGARERRCRASRARRLSTRGKGDRAMTAASPAATPHVPVLLDEVVDALAIAPGETHVDGTFGAGGYTRAILEHGAARVFAFDRDPDAIQYGEALAASSGGRLTLVPERFSRMRQALSDRGVEAVDGVTLDIGVSSMQLDQAERGFSFQADGPLDMRMGKDGRERRRLPQHVPTKARSPTSSSIMARSPSRAGSRARSSPARPIERTGQLAEIVRKALGHKPGMKKDPATRTFQAIRIHVNDELGELEGGLAAAEQVLAPGGRLAVVTFHSLEDRIVKRFLKERSGDAAVGLAPSAGGERNRRPSPPSRPSPSRSAPARPRSHANPRARSATLRAARRTVRAVLDQPEERSIRDDRQGFQAGRLGRRRRRRRARLLHALASGRRRARRAGRGRAPHRRRPASTIRSLQTELGTRGRLQQLEQWNAEVLALSAPVAGQFLEANVSLARFDIRAAPLRATRPRFGSRPPRPSAPSRRRPAQCPAGRGRGAGRARDRRSRRGHWSAMPALATATVRPARRPAPLPCRRGRRVARSRHGRVRRAVTAAALGPRRRRAGERQVRPAPTRTRSAAAPPRQATAPARAAPAPAPSRAPPCSTTAPCATCAPNPAPSAAGAPQLMATLAAHVDRPVQPAERRAARPRR